MSRSIAVFLLALLGAGSVFTWAVCRSSPDHARRPAHESAKKPAHDHPPRAEVAAKAEVAAETTAAATELAAAPVPPAAPRAKGHKQHAATGARDAILQDLESSLGARVVAHWDKKGSPYPTSLRLERAAAHTGSPVEVARSVVSKVADTLGEHCTVLAPGEAVPKEGHALVAEAPIRTGDATTVVFLAFLDGAPLEDGTIKVELHHAAGGLVPVTVVGQLHMTLREGSVSALRTER